MEPVRNHWIDENRKEISRIKRNLVEQSYAGQDGVFNYMRIHNIIGGCLVEILKLQTEVNDLKKQITSKQEKVQVVTDKK